MMLLYLYRSTITVVVEVVGEEVVVVVKIQQCPAICISNALPDPTD